ncbi:Kynurenine formamidase [Scheffersomyces spartinae]|uniref:Kynurenine formamidase n=1 Tax=Scheffersomyces spartinae TaxID=45513 RepID=A0A9P7V574_9ASCO|nr:Kynurenine formamidase [Scheffersomyces spartinae]KAG7191413.1 Kynurenine formamidase [Scheffersomyces spartinae]
MVTTTIESYGDDPLQYVKTFHYDSDNHHRNIVFIHGGAWRDRRNTVDDFELMIKYIHSNTRQFNLFSISYRLSPEIKHPYHLVDVIEALKWLNSHYGVLTTTLVGHSVGATLCLQLLNYKTLLAEEDIVVDTEKLDIKLSKIFLLDGIFDLVKLVEEYGAPYQEFIDEAFESEQQYKRALQLSNDKFNVVGYSRDFESRLYIVYSLDDELLSPRQHELLVDHYLKKFGVRVSVISGHWGLHEQMYKDDRVSQLILDSVDT